MTIDLTNEIVSGILFLLVCLFFVLLYIAYLLKNLKIGVSEKVVEKHFVSSNGNIKSNDSKTETITKEESPEERKRKIEESIQFREKWNNQEVKSNVNEIGKKTVIDGKSSLNAVELMRKLGKGKVVEDE